MSCETAKRYASLAERDGCFQNHSLLQQPVGRGVPLCMKSTRCLPCLVALMTTLMGSAAMSAEAKPLPPPEKPAEANSPAEAAQKPASKPAPPIKPPSEAELRAMITRGLGFLAKEGDQWMEDKNCTSCHHMPELLWSHREAKRRGFAIDQAKYDEWLEWSVERSADKKAGLEAIALMVLALPDRPAAELTKLLTAEQKADGTWTPAGQFATMQKRGEADSKENATRLSLLALLTAKPPASDATAAQGKAVPSMQRKTAPTSMESLAFRAVYAQCFGQPEEVKSLCREIIQHQRGDGGWSSFIGANMSDPLATGQALWALHLLPSDPPATAAMARAQHWLLKTQRVDGSWPIDITHISKIDRSAPAKANSFKAATDIYTYWGSGWATIGLLQDVPVK